MKRLPRWIPALLSRPAGAVGAVVVLVMLLSALLSLFRTPYNLLDTNVDNAWAGPSGEHWLGTDRLGRDIFTRLLLGSQSAVLVTVGATALAGVIGLSLAALGALAPWRISEPLNVLVDILIAFPTLLLAMLIAAPFGGSLGVVIVAAGFGYGVNLARVVRPEITRVQQADFMLAARAAGTGRVRAVLRHTLPNVAPVIIVQLSLAAAVSLLVEAGLTYLGYGAPTSMPSWGRLLAESQALIEVQPLSVLWPGLTITLAVLGLTLLGDGLRTAIDPRLIRQRRPAEEGFLVDDVPVLGGLR